MDQLDRDFWKMLQQDQEEEARQEKWMLDFIKTSPRAACLAILEALAEDAQEEGKRRRVEFWELGLVAAQTLARLEDK